MATAEKSPYNHFPETIAMRNGDGDLEHIADPCYRCKSPQFLGDTFFDEGEVIVTAICPNDELEPLNRAAAANMDKWRATLPMTGVKIDLGDLSEAALRLRDHPDLAKMTNEQVSATIHKLAIAIVNKREGEHGLTVPPVGGNEARRASRSTAPAMANARFTDPSQPGPSVRDSAVLHEPVRPGAAAAARIKSPLHNAPPPAGR